MRRLLGPVGERAVVNEIKRFELFTDGRSAMVPLQEPDLIIERSELIRGLAREAQDHGARLELGRRFASLESKGSGVELTFERAGSAAPERVAAEFVVGADGAYSAVAKAAGWRPQPTVPLVQALVDLPEGMPSDSVRVWFRPDDTPYFYWLIPESEQPRRAGPDRRRRARNAPLPGPLHGAEELPSSRLPGRPHSRLHVAGRRSSAKSAAAASSSSATPPAR